MGTTKNTIVLAALVSLAACVSAQAVILRWEFTSDESQVKNAMTADGSTNSPGTGEGLIDYDTDTNVMSVRLTWNDTIGDITKLHLHGSADENSSTPRHLVEFLGPPTPELGVNYSGTATNGIFENTFELTTLTQPVFDPIEPEQVIREMESGLTYLNIHTTVFGMGELRGNLGVPRIIPEPSSLLAATGLAGLIATRRRTRRQR